MRRLIKQVVSKIMRGFFELLYRIPRGTFESGESKDIFEVVFWAAKEGYSYVPPFLNEKELHTGVEYDLSIIVPIYNVEKYVEVCVDSLMNQKTSFAYEIILVDDGSTDDSGIICDRYSKRERVKIVHQNNKGLSGARNTGIKLAAGKYLSFVDSDDWVSPDYVNTLVSKAIEADADIVKANYTRTTNLTEKDDSGVFFNEDRSYCGEMGEDILVYKFAWGAVYKRELWERVRFPEGFLFEDMMIHFLVYHEANRIEFIKNQLYFYRTSNPSSIVHTWTKETLNPKVLDHVFLLYSTVEYMTSNQMLVDGEILKLALRESGPIVLSRTNRRYQKIAFGVAALSVDRVINCLSGDLALGLSEIEKRFLFVLEKRRFYSWKALCLSIRWGK